MYEIEFEIKAPASEGNHPLYRTWGNISWHSLGLECFPLRFPYDHQGSASVEVSRSWKSPLMCKDHLSQTEGSCLLSYTHRDILKATLEHCGGNHTFQANIFSHILWFSSYCGMFCYVKNFLRGI